MVHSDTAWMGRGDCVTRSDLPWLDDIARVSRWQHLGMQAVCAGCPVLAACAAYVQVAQVSGGFWAGGDRDPDAGMPTAVQGVLPPFEPVA